MSTIALSLTSSSITTAGSPASITASVTNSADVPARIVLGAFSNANTTGPDPRTWATVERPLREIGPHATESFTITVEAPTGTGAGQYGLRFIAYDADRPPEEYSDQAQTLQVIVESGKGAVAASRTAPWWIYAVAACLVLIVGSVAFFVLRSPQKAPPPGPPPTPSATPSPTPSATPSPAPSFTFKFPGSQITNFATVNPKNAQIPLTGCMAPYVQRLARPGDTTCVTTQSAQQAQADNQPDVQDSRLLKSNVFTTNACVEPFKWRFAWDTDQICVTPETATRTWFENQGYPEGHA